MAALISVEHKKWLSLPREEIADRLIFRKFDTVCTFFSLFRFFEGKKLLFLGFSYKKGKPFSVVSFLKKARLKESAEKSAVIFVI